MDTNDIYNILLMEGSCTLKGAELELDNLRRRLIQKRYRENKKLGEFADKSVRLEFEWLQRETAQQPAMLRIALKKRAAPLDGVEIVREDASADETQNLFGEL